MFRLLLLLLVGTIYAQESENYAYGDEGSDQDDIEDTADPGSQDDGSDMSDHLPATDLSHCHLHKCHNATLVIEKGLERAGVCPDKGTCHYQVFNCPRNFWTAQSACRCSRGILSSIHNLWANNQVRCLAQRTCRNQHYAWIGMYKYNTCRGYANVDGSRVDYTNWACGQFRTHGTWCTAINLSNGQWYSLYCSTLLPYVCTI
ncbi:bone marrow proteoglycan-like [Mixophyes fleayi]|uniref:bone marrow proteoglycan-like n=1 Tax=Mixophyes fleayi TaxID=3061075 RepID=UPI003F4E0918